jgi:hypothetical protein
LQLRLDYISGPGCRRVRTMPGMYQENYRLKEQIMSLMPEVRSRAGRRHYFYPEMPNSL